MLLQLVATLQRVGEHSWHLRGFGRPSFTLNFSPLLELYRLAGPPLVAVGRPLVSFSSTHDVVLNVVDRYILHELSST